uniref:Tyrosine-protein kinase n=1 Tax=Caenorhabditis japonica TaxID=281687 RepID=A0A8R1HGB4_CAEJA
MSTDNSMMVAVERGPWFHGLLPREDVRLLLDKNGDFLVRQSETKPGEARSYILSVMFNNQLDDIAAVRHFVIMCSDYKYFINQVASFESIHALIEHHLRTNSEIQDGVRIATPVRRQYWELNHTRIRIQKKLGEGAFGEVSAGIMRFKKGGKQVQVAIKQAKLEKMGKDQIKDFMMEARTMRKLGHMNVVKFYGVAVLQEPVYLVMELASNGALDSYLKKNEDTTVEKRTEMLLQAAWGLEYIHGKPMLHRDIASRNCLYGDGKVKISDFGLTRPGTFYQMRPGTKAPIRWLAIETMRVHIYSQKTDVWSYGVLAWEIFNNCAEPYPGLKTCEVMSQVQGGYRMPPPPNAAPEVQAMMKKIFSENANDRPSMAEIAVILQRVTGQPRPNFQAIAQKEAAELLLMNSVTQKTVTRRRGKKASLPKGM